MLSIYPNNLISFGEPREVRYNYAGPIQGRFGLEVDPPMCVNFDHCRENFAKRFVDAKGLYFSHPENKSEDVAAFLVKTEFVINITKLNFNYSTFNKTQKNNVLWINPSQFWLECNLRRSLLTILLRCGMHYNADQDNYEDTLFSEKYDNNVFARDTKKAVMRFLFGFTRYYGATMEGVTPGWRDIFRNLNDEQVCKKLGSPIEEIPNFVGINAIWN